jgi:hypothetical protein
MTLVPRRRLLGLVVALLGVFLLGVEAPAQSPRTVADTLDLAPDGTVELNVAAGRVQATTWDRPAVGMTVQIEGESATQVENTRVQVDEQSDRVTIKTEGEEAGDLGLWALLGFEETGGPKLNYALRLPATASLSVTTESAPVEVRGLGGDVTIEGSSAPVRLRDVTGDAIVATFSGPLDADSVRGKIIFATFSGSATVRVRELVGDNQFASFSGDAEITLPADAAFDLRTDITWGGGVTSDFATPDSAAQGADTIPIGGGGPTVAFESFSGSLTLRAE